MKTPTPPGMIGADGRIPDLIDWQAAATGTAPVGLRFSYSTGGTSSYVSDVFTSVRKLLPLNTTTRTDRLLNRYVKTRTEYFGDGAGAASFLFINCPPRASYESYDGLYCCVVAYRYEVKVDDQWNGRCGLWVVPEFDALEAKADDRSRGLRGYIPWPQSFAECVAGTHAAELPLTDSFNRTWPWTKSESYDPFPPKGATACLAHADFELASRMADGDPEAWLLAATEFEKHHSDLFDLNVVARKIVPLAIEYTAAKVAAVFQA